MGLGGLSQCPASLWVQILPLIPSLVLMHRASAGQRPQTLLAQLIPHPRGNVGPSKPSSALLENPSLPFQT